MQMYVHEIDPLVLFIGAAILLILIVTFAHRRGSDDIWNRSLSVIEFLVSLVIWQVLDMFLFLYIFIFTSGSEIELYLRFYIGRIALFLGIVTLLILVEKYRGLPKKDSEKTVVIND